MAIITYTHCPGCASADIEKRLSAKDYTVSGEVFEIWQCAECTLRFTQHIPDPQQIIRYYKSEDYISHSDTKKGLVNSLYHTVRKQTLKSKEKLLVSCSGRKQGVLLDIGAGTGAFAGHMKKGGWQVTALEPDAEARNKAAAAHHINILPAEQLWSLPGGSFDVITMWHVLEHVHDLKNYLATLKALLNTGGKVFIAVPNYTSFDAAYYGEWWAAYDVPRHLYHFSPTSFRHLVKPIGFKIEDIQPMWFDSFYVSMLSEKYKTGKNNYARAFATGLQSNLRAMKDKEACSSLIYILSADS